MLPEFYASWAGWGPVDLLHLLRESIQTHRHIVCLFAGSHAIEELTHAEWPSYLISARTVEISAFTEAEIRLLLTEPEHKGGQTMKPRLPATQRHPPASAKSSTIHGKPPLGGDLRTRGTAL